MVAAGEEVKQLEDLCAAADLCTYCPDMGRGGGDGGKGAAYRNMSTHNIWRYENTRRYDITMMRAGAVYRVVLSRPCSRRPCCAATASRAIRGLPWRAAAVFRLVASCCILLRQWPTVNP